MKRILTCMLILAVALMASAKVYLVAVGISDYPGEGSDLNLPAKDANTIAWVYTKNGDVEYTLLTDSNATNKKILKAMETKFSKAKEDDIVVFFFSGHGYEGGLLTYGSGNGPGLLQYSRIRKAMAKSPCKNKMIFADACYSGNLRPKNTGEAHNDPKDEKEEARKANVMLFLSSRDNETSRERRDMQNGFFTTYLQKGLRGKADTNHDNVITARELFLYVHNGVKQLSGDIQHPVMWGNFSDDMPVLRWDKKKASQPQTSVSETQKQ